MSYLSARSLTKTVNEASIVSEVTIDVEIGEFVVIAGPNGAGKSTLLGMLAGLVSPTEGQVTIAGDEPGQLTAGELALRRSFLPPAAPPRSPFTTRQVISMGLHPWNPQDDDMATVESALDTVDLSNLANHRFDSLSSGEARRAELGRILVQDTPLVLLDEPTNGLDIAHEESILAAFARLVEKGKAVVATTHHLAGAVRHATRLVLMDSGKMVANGTPDEVLNGDLLSELYDYPIAVTNHPFRSGWLIDALDPEDPSPL